MEVLSITLTIVILCVAALRCVAVSPSAHKRVQEVNLPDATEMIQRQVEMQREQLKLWEDQRRLAAEITRHEMVIIKQQNDLNKATDDIDYLSSQIEHFKKYGKYLELERDACAIGSSNWHKWNNKVNTNDAKVHKLFGQLDKAYEARETAQKKLEVV